ncbi:MAG: TolC family protein [Paracoccus sp. (in: a-proteobacteria)]|nr:TolC family protein [Paracoccus sp. (in: a-proteobacteria)]
MTYRLTFPFLAALLLSACAAAPELDGAPTAAMRAAEFQPASGAPQVIAQPGSAWRLDFGDAGLARMLAEADAGGLDVASARARFKAADLTYAQQRRDSSGMTPGASVSAGREGLTINASLGIEPDLAGRFDAALRGGALEHAASGIDLWLARRTLAREVTLGWIALAEARTRAARLGAEIAAEDRAIALLEARLAAGEITSSELAARRQTRSQARAQEASAATQIGLAEARLRSLGARTIPAAISLKSAQRPALGAQTDLAHAASIPEVCAAFLRFHAADAARAQTLADARPRLVATSSLSVTARSLAALASGNVLALGNMVSLEGTLVDGGAARAQLDQARVSVAQAEIEWLRAVGQAEIAALESVAARQNAEVALDGALESWRAADAELGRVQLRRDAGLADGLDLAEAERARLGAQREIDSARADAFRAAATGYETLPARVPACAPAPRTQPSRSL